MKTYDHVNSCIYDNFTRDRKMVNNPGILQHRNGEVTREIREAINTPANLDKYPEDYVELIGSQSLKVTHWVIPLIK